MAAGHLFVIRGAIGEVVADVAIVSTDAKFSVRDYWHTVVSPNGQFKAEDHRPAGWDARGWGRDRNGQQLWFLDVTRASTSGDAFDRLRLILADIAGAGIRSRVEGRPLPLVVLPVIGTKGGGFDRQRGTVIDRLLKTCRDIVAKNDIDIAVVAQDAATFAALQHRRKAELNWHFEGINLDLAARLGRAAREGSLALCIGAGTSIPAGAPSWDGLLETLAREAGLDDDVRAGFKDLGPLDQAELLNAQPDWDLGQQIATKVDKKSPALAHVLLANLHCQAAVTTNYDRLYELATASAGDQAATILPSEIPPPDGRWLLKMHGDVKKPWSIVLTRSQFVGFTSASGPAGAVLQSLLLTKHLLVVGTSMKDDNLLRLIHEVAAYRNRLNEPGPGESSDPPHVAGSQFGTILSVDNDPARRELHKPYFAWEQLAGNTLPIRARQLEIFLDAVAMFASGDHSWLLDRRFAHLLTDQQGLAERVRALAAEIDGVAIDGSAWSALSAELRKFGAAPPKAPAIVGSVRPAGAALPRRTR